MRAKLVLPACLLLVLAPLVLAACARQSPGEPGRPGTEWPAGRTFVATGVTGHVQVLGTVIQITFTDTGEVSANAGCNHLSGNGEIVDGKLVVDGMGGTDMGCDPPRHAQDQWVSSFLASRPAFALDGDVLTLKTETASMTFTDREVVDPDRALTGTRWNLDSIISGDATSSTPQGVTAYVTFAADGSMTGHGGCNGFGGSAKVDEAKKTIVFTELISTKMACQGAKQDLETTVFRILDGTVAYEIDAQTLRLTKTDGTGLSFRAAA